MENWSFIASLLQLCVGVAGVVAYIVLAVNGEPLGKWTVTLLLAVAFITLGVLGLIKKD